MQVVKWGKSLAVRLPARLVRDLGLKEGDEIDIRPDGSGLSAVRHQRPEEILASLRKYRGRLPARERISRDEANER